MGSDVLVYLYIIANAIAFLSSLPVHRLDIFPYRVISTVMALDLIVELWANIMWAQFHLSNLPVYNFAMLAEFWLYAFYFGEVLRSRLVQRMIRVYLWLLPPVWLILAFFHVRDWSSFFFVFGAIFTIILSAINYYQLFTAERLVRLSTSFEFWIATGLIIFYSISFPYLGMLNFLNKNHLSIALTMLTVLHIANIIFYLIFTYAFLCTKRIRRSS